MKKIILTLCCLFISNNIMAKLPDTIKFASEATYPPFESMNSAGELQGFDIDIAKAICKQMKLNCIFSNQPWESLIPGLTLGKFDAIISAMDITEDRSKQVDFSTPYFSPTGSFVARKSANLDATAQSLKGKTIGVQKGTTFEKYVTEKYKSDIRLKTYPSFQNVMLDLNSGRIDVAMGDTPIIEDWLKNNDPQEIFVLLGKPIYNPEDFGIGYGIAIKKGNTELLKAINEGLRKIKKNGIYEKIFLNYFPHQRAD
jgi:arginine transport system substrate-binding protein